MSHSIPKTVLSLVLAIGVLSFSSTDALGESGNDRTVKVLRTSNKAQTNRYVPKVYEFKNANPYFVRAYIQRAMEVEEGSYYTFVHPDGKSGLFLVICPEHQIPYLDSLVAKLDRPGQTTLNKWKRTYLPTKHRSVVDEDFINTLFSNYGAPDFFTIDPETNCILSVGAPSNVDAIAGGLEVLDHATPQARVEVAVYEVALQNDTAVGLDYMAWKNGPGRNLFAVGAFAEHGRVEQVNGNTELVIGDQSGLLGLPGQRAQSYGSNVAYRLNVSSAYFDYLASKGKARVVNKASVAAMSDTTFEVKSVDRVLFTETHVGEGSGVREPNEPLDPEGSNPEFPDNRTVVMSEEEVGITVHGHIWLADEGNIVAEVENEVANLSGFSGSGHPIVSHQDYKTEVTVEPGSETVIGGLIRQRTIESSSKVPVLGSIPVLGWFFGGEKDIVQKSLVTVILRADRFSDFSGMTPFDSDVIGKAKREIDTPVGSAPAGFDQWGLDR